jgi:hypothetical protein
VPDPQYAALRRELDGIVDGIHDSSAQEPAVGLDLRMHTPLIPTALRGLRSRQKQKSINGFVEPGSLFKDDAENVFIRGLASAILEGNFTDSS